MADVVPEPGSMIFRPMAAGRIPPAAVVIEKDIHTRIAVCPICDACGAIVTECEIKKARLDPTTEDFAVVELTYVCGWCENRWTYREEGYEPDGA